jgi:tetratricopeptide (TPR) repeat protein
MKKKILVTLPLLTLTGVSSVGSLEPVQSQTPPLGQNPLRKELKVFQHFSNSVNAYDLAITFMVVGAILALSATISVVLRGRNLEKPSARRTAPQHQSKKDELQTIAQPPKSVTKQSEASTYLAKAYTSLQQGNAQKALAEFNYAISVYPYNAYLYTERANFRRKNLGDREGAIEDYTQAINIHPDNALFYLWRSQIYHEIGDMLKAMADYNTAIRLAPENTMYHFIQPNAVVTRR